MVTAWVKLWYTFIWIIELAGEQKLDEAVVSEEGLSAAAAKKEV